MKRFLLPVIAAVGFLWPATSHAASLFFSPSSQKVEIGDTLSLTVKVGAGGQAINSAEATVTYPTSILTLTSVSKGSSIFSFWALNPSAANDGSVSFIGGLPNPGFSGSNGTAIRLTFTAKAAGIALIKFSGGKVLANDGYGTNVLQSQGSGTVTVAEKTSGGGPTPSPEPSTPGRPTPSLSSSEYPDQNAWRSTPSATVAWTKPTGIQGVSLVIDGSPGTVPDEAVDAVSSPLTVTFEADGVRYVHLRAKYESGWSSTATYALRHDATAPEAFSVTIQQDRGSADPTPTAVFVTTDATSGVASYTISTDGGAAVPATSPHQLSMLLGGLHEVVVTAVDRAGNQRSSSATLTVTGYQPPVVTSLTSPIMLLESFTVAGTAAVGDVVVILLDGQTLGQVTAGPGGDTATGPALVQAPWSYTSTQLIGPGKHAVTVRAIGPDGQQSITTDPAQLFVVGNTILFRGRPVATIALAPPIAIGVIALLLLNAYVYFRLLRHAHRLWRHEQVAEQDLETLRQRVRRERLTGAELDAKLRAIELDLEETRPAPSGRRRRFSRRSKV